MTFRINAFQGVAFTLDSQSVLVGLLNTYGAVSVNRIHVLLGILMGVGLSTGAIASITARCAPHAAVAGNGTAVLQ